MHVKVVKAMSTLIKSFTKLPKKIQKRSESFSYAVYDFFPAKLRHIENGGSHNAKYSVWE